MEFLGREAELAALEAAYASPQSAFFPIYGRRRVGKTELILRLMRGRLGLYFLGKRAPAGEQIREFLENAALVFGEPLLGELQVDNWKKALTQALARLLGVVRAGPATALPSRTGARLFRDR
jgi:uncharacterized protein